MSIETETTKRRWRVNELGRTVECEDGSHSYTTVGVNVARGLAAYLNALESQAALGARVAATLGFWRVSVEDDAVLDSDRAEADALLAECRAAGWLEETA